jgi:hypothetical protein
MNPEANDSEFRPRPREGADIHPAIIVRVALIFVAGLALSLGLVLGLFRHFEITHPARTSEASPQVAETDLPPQPRLQTTPALDLQQLRAAEDERLSRYAWIDRSRGLAQIPIDRAMDLWVRTQAAVTVPTAANPGAPGLTELQMRQDKAKEATHAP